MNLHESYFSMMYVTYVIHSQCELHILTLILKFTHSLTPTPAYNVLETHEITYTILTHKAVSYREVGCCTDKQRKKQLLYEQNTFIYKFLSLTCLLFWENPRIVIFSVVSVR